MSDIGRGGPTLAVIAREALVSVPTVSKVINGRSDVAAETRRRVTEVLERRGYLRRTVTPGVKGANFVDVIALGLGTSFASTLLAGVEENAHRAGIDIVVSALAGRTHRLQPARGWLDRIANRGAAGVLLILAEPTATQRAWLADHHVPCVVIEPVTAAAAEWPSVGAANQAGAIAATEHLIGLRHERIAIIIGQTGRRYSQTRLDGYRAAMAAAGLPVRPEYVVPGDFGPGGGRCAMLRLLDLPEPPTAVFACSDLMAVGVYEVLRERGVRVPDEMSVVGFDDVLEARCVTPALTTVRQPLPEMAAAAMDMLVGMIHGTQPDPLRVELPTELIMRASTAPLPSSGRG